MLSYQDFNELDEKALRKMDGIGKLVAVRIVLNRPFRSNKDLLKIKGLGKRTLVNLGVAFKTRAKRDKTTYTIDGQVIDVSTRAYAKNIVTGKIDYFWRIDKSNRDYLG
jgi:transcriptional accessory protein Tex/SPT6